MKDSKLWLIYSAYTHDIVAETEDIKSFLASQPGMSKNAHIQIYKTNTYDSNGKKVILPTYKGYFIREKGDENPPVFPAKRYRDPTGYKLFEINSESEITKIAEIKDLDSYIKDNGYSDSDKTLLLRTCKIKRDGEVNLSEHNGLFLRPVGENVPVIKPPKKKYVKPDHHRGRGEKYAIFDKDLNIVDITSDLVGFIQGYNEKHLKENPGSESFFNYHKPFYKTNTPSKENPNIPRSDFYKGFFIRAVKDLESGNNLYIPAPSASVKSAYNSHLDLLVWNKSIHTDEGIIGYFVPSHQKTVGIKKINKAKLYETAKSYRDGFTSVDGYHAIFIKDIIEDKSKIMELLADEDVILPKEIANRIS